MTRVGKQEIKANAGGLMEGVDKRMDTLAENKLQRALKVRTRSLVFDALEDGKTMD